MELGPEDVSLLERCPDWLKDAFQYMCRIGPCSVAAISLRLGCNYNSITCFQSSC